MVNREQAVAGRRKLVGSSSSQDVMFEKKKAGEIGTRMICRKGYLEIKWRGLPFPGLGPLGELLSTLHIQSP